MLKVVDSLQSTVHRQKKSVYRLLSTVYRSGFTLVELLVVVSIIAVLSSIGYASFRNAADKGRDAHRKADLKAISGALVSYYQDHDTYPPTCSSPCSLFQSTSDQASPWIPELTSGSTPYLKTLPKDPRQAGLITNLARLIKPKVSKNQQVISQVAGTSTGPNNPNNAVENTSVGSISWINYSDIRTSNNTYASNGNVSTNLIMRYIKATGYGFSIPASAVINGITVVVERKSNWSGWGQDYSLRLVKGDSILGNNYADTSSTWSSTEAAISYGGSSDLWGLTWTPTDINASNFGVVFSAKNNNISADIQLYVDNISVSVDYTTPTPTPSPTPNPAPFTIGSVTQIAKEIDPIGPNSIDVCGTDLGSMFDWNGKVYNVFGDTFGCPLNPSQPNWRSNTLATTTDTTPADGITFDNWIVGGDGKAKELIPNDAGPPNETAIPTYGVSIGSTGYLYYFEGTISPWICNYSSVAKSTDGGQNWTKLTGLQWAPGNFNQVAIYKNGGYVYFFGIPCARAGSVRLMRVAEASIEIKTAYEYLTGFNGSNPIWTVNAESSAINIVPAPVGELSVRWDNYLGQYIMMYLRDVPPYTIEIRSATNLWGSWSDWQAVTTGTTYPCLYAPFMREGYDENNGQTVYFRMSRFCPGFNPYSTYWMKMTLNGTGPSPSPSPAPSPSPPAAGLDGDCNGQDNVYCYIVSANRSTFILWAQLDNTNDPDSPGYSQANCNYTSPGGNTKYNFCLEAPK